MGGMLWVVLWLLRTGSVMRLYVYMMVMSHGYE
jgi:hypothetical protein